MNSIDLAEQYGYKRTPKGIQYALQGELEFIIRDPITKAVHQVIREPNIVKIQAKEILAHRLPHSKIWDPNSGTGSGAWVSSGIDPNNEFSAKYILFGASFDANGAPLDTTDTRYYILDTITGSWIPIRLGVGAEYDGALINAIPIAEPNRGLKKIERIYFESSYQPAGTPLLQDDVRAMNNIVVMETTLQKSEYNGFGLTNSDSFTITEVALAAGKEIDTVGACECDPKEIFLEGRIDGTAITINTTGTATVSIDPVDIAYSSTINEGDQVKIVDADGTANSGVAGGQINPYYLVVSKSIGGSDITLDRTPVDSSNVALSGQLGIFRQTLRIFSHRILSKPFLKSSDFEILCRWCIIMG